ncbi:hypothetical protein OROMI_027963 [Orobanche minor]
MASDRSWIGRHKDSNGRVIDEYMTGVHGFLDFAFSHEDYVEDNKITTVSKFYVLICFPLFDHASISTFEAHGSRKYGRIEFEAQARL